MAINANCVWEVDSATGNDTNGGGFDSISGTPGTDYTYGAGQTVIVYTDLVIGTTTTQLSSSARNFVAADVGNIINITSGTGFTTGRYQIMSVAAGVATCDRSVGTASSTGGNGRLGGSLASPGIVGTAFVGSNICWIKSNGSTYNISTTSANVSNGRFTLANGSVQSFSRLRGYGSTRGDTGRATLKWTTGATFDYIVGGGYLLIENIIFDGNRATYTTMGVDSGSKSTYLKNCIFKSFGKQCINCSSGVVHCENCEFYDNKDAAFGGSTTVLIGCYFHDYSTSGIIVVGSALILNCIFDTCPSSAVSANYGAVVRIFNSTFYNIGSHAVITGDTGITEVYNCHFDTVTGYAISPANTTNVLLIKGNSYYSCSSGFMPSAYSNVPYVSDTVAITAGAPLTDPANQDFTPNSTASRGALMRGTGKPSSFVGLTVGSYPNIGAVRHQDPTSGGGLLVGPSNLVS